MHSNVAALLTSLVKDTDYRPTWVSSDLRQAGSSKSIGHYNATYFGIHNTDSSAATVTVWPMDMHDGSTWIGSGTSITIPAGGVFYVYVGKVTWSGTTYDNKLVLLGSLAPSLNR